MKRRRLRGDRRGLTLIELVLTLTILSLAGALAAGALATGLRSWKTGLLSGRAEFVARIVLERLATQLRAAVLTPASRNQEPAVAFDATDEHLRFVTLAAAGTAPVQVFYGLLDVEGEPKLVYREYPWPDKEFFGAGRPRREEIIEEISGFSLKVVKRSDDAEPDAIVPGDVQSAAEWSPLDRELPASVSVDISVKEAGSPEPRHYQIVVPILTQGVLP